MHPLDPGLTWPLYSEDPPGTATPWQRIDLILQTGIGLRDQAIIQTGGFPTNGSWPSDHSGVFGQFVILP